jgi:hypothetical protein
MVDLLLKKGTKHHADGWDAASKAWAHIVLHLPHADGGFGVTFNDITKDAAFYTATSRFVAWLGAFSQERQGLWLLKDALPGARARPGRDSQDGVSQQQEAAPLFVPQLDRLYEANVRGVDASNVAAIPLSTGSHSKSSHGGSRLKTSSGHLRSCAARNSFAFTRSSA